MKGIFTVVVSLFLLTAVLPANAQESRGFSHGSPVILPNNPSYSLKLWWKSLQSFFAESRAEKTMTELNRLGEMAEEIELMFQYGYKGKFDSMVLRYARQAQRVSALVQELHHEDLQNISGFRSEDAFINHVLTHLIKHIDFINQKLLPEDLQEETLISLHGAKQALIDAVSSIQLTLDDEESFFERLMYIIVVEQSTFAQNLVQEFQSR
ncbi:MAG: hypothetical protein Q8P45_03245 [Candidatus Harrisonbacteria bacterium]|nr:hypothetical protein [Candidatus Harrisonbacteria bacterium]